MRYMLPLLLALTLPACQLGCSVGYNTKAGPPPSEDRDCREVLAEAEASFDAAREVCDYWMLQRCGCTTEAPREPSPPPACGIGYDLSEAAEDTWEDLR